MIIALKQQFVYLYKYFQKEKKVVHFQQWKISVNIEKIMEVVLTKTLAQFLFKGIEKKSTEKSNIIFFNL